MELAGAQKLDADLKITPLIDSETENTAIFNKRNYLFLMRGVFEIVSIGESGAHVVIPLENTSTWEDDPFYEEGQSPDPSDKGNPGDSGFDLNGFEDGLNCQKYSDGVLDIAWVASDNKSKVLNILTSFGAEDLDGINTPSVLSAEIEVVEEALEDQNLTNAKINFFPLSKENVPAEFSTIDKIVRDKQIPDKLIELQGTKNV